MENNENYIKKEDISYEVAKKLLGEIDPVGCASRDPERLENLKNTCQLVIKLLRDIDFVSRNKDSNEGTVKTAGQYAENFIDNIMEEI